jgi:hypothetical protein
MITAINRKENVSDPNQAGDLDNLFGYTASDVENVGTIEVVNSGNLDLALEEFEDYLELSPHIAEKRKTKLCLLPGEINHFLNLIENYHEHTNYFWRSGTFTSKLMGQSYLNGNNRFNLNIGEHPVSHLAIDLKASEDNPIKISIEGDVGGCFASSSENLDIVINGNCENSFGWSSENICVKINGSVGGFFGKSSNNLTALISQNANKMFSYGSKYLSAIIKGNSDGDLGIYSSDLTVFVYGDLAKCCPKEDRYIYTADNIKGHEKYIQIMAKLNARFGK